MPLNRDAPDVVLLRHNLTVLMRSLRSLQISLVEVRYAGARGRCQPCQVNVTPRGTSTLATRVVLQRAAAGAGQVPVALMDDEVGLAEGLQRFVLHWASLEHGHWQRGDGGRGVMRLDVATGQATLDHDALHIEQFHATLKV